MTGHLYIDGTEIYSSWGVVVQEGGYDELMAYPALKKVDSNDWQEHDGTEADLSAPRLNSRELTINFIATRGYDGLAALAERLSDMAYHTFYNNILGRTFRLRLVKQPNLSWNQALGFTAFRFADDFPLEGYTYREPQSSIAPYEDYLLDGRPLTDYGVRALEGTLASIDKAPDVKTLLLRNIGTRSGADYDSLGTVTYKSKDIQVNCLMRAQTMEEMWCNHDALLYDLTRPGERRLRVTARGRDIPCYYKSCRTGCFYHTGKLWWQFTLTLTATTFRLQLTQDGLRLITSNGLLLLSDGSMRLLNSKKY